MQRLREKGKEKKSKKDRSRSKDRKKHKDKEKKKKRKRSESSSSRSSYSDRSRSKSKPKEKKRSPSKEDNDQKWHPLFNHLHFIFQYSKMIGWNYKLFYKIFWRSFSVLFWIFWLIFFSKKEESCFFIIISLIEDHTLFNTVKRVIKEKIYTILFNYYPRYLLIFWVCNRW